MAVFADISELRLRIKDPLGVIAFLSVADKAALYAVAAPARQTAYLQIDTGDYHIYEGGAWEPQDLLLSDMRLGLLIDLYGIAGAAPRAIKEIKAELGRRLYVAQISDGAGSTIYQNLTTMRAFYDDLIATFEQAAEKDAGTSCGRYLRIRHPHIGGGMHG
jgi:hypothetical protein